MIKRVLCFFICLLLFVNMIFPVAANRRRVYDDADLFTVQQETALEEKISQVKEQAALDLVIVTALSTGNKDAQAYADDFFDDGGFGMGDDNSGVLLESASVPVSPLQAAKTDTQISSASTNASVDFNCVRI